MARGRPRRDAGPLHRALRPEGANARFLEMLARPMSVAIVAHGAVDRFGALENCGPNPGDDYGGRLVTAWLDR